MKHLEDHGLTYNQHRQVATKFAWMSFKAGFCAMIHGVFPSLFQSTAKDIHKSILPKYEQMIKEIQNK